MKTEPMAQTVAPRRWGQIVSVGIVVVIGVGLLWWLNRPAPEEIATNQTTATLPETVTLSSESLELARLEIRTLQFEPLMRTLTLFGQIEPLPENLVNLNSRVTGRVLEIRAHVGDTVKRGQVLAVLDSEEIYRAEVNYAQAKRQLEFARAELERRKRLAQLGAYSNPALEDARAKLAQARAELQAAEADARAAQNAVETAQAALSKAQTHLQQTRAQLSRAERLLQAQLIAQQEYESIRAQYEIAQAEVQSAQAQLDSARAAQQAAATRLQTARETFQIAQQQAERAEQVFKGQYLNAKEIADAEANYRQAQLALEAALDELRLLGGKPDGGHQLVLTAPFDGRIAALEVTVGETVTPDKPIFRILNTNAVWVSFDIHPDDLPYVRTGQSLRFSVDSVPNTQFEATVQLLMPEADPNKRVVKARCVVSNPDSRLKPGLFVRAELPVVIEPRALVVPAEAVQAALEVTVGETVTPDKPIFRILNTNALWVSFDIHPDDLPYVRTGQSLRFSVDSMPNTQFEAAVQLLMPEADPNKRVVKARCVVSNPDSRLKPGLFVRAELPVVIEPRALVVPAEAVQRIEGKPYLFVATGREGGFALRPVQLGQTVNNQVVIRDGVKAGERVVVRNASLITGMLFGGGEE
ncbi:MAG: hypothetical protein KatS3mg017_0635 [Fimbriimonadales bacterium]|nr:MAG: hypothetical protein KatS3mg017_0635 [Fimbriimonadales bacterium]